MTTRFAGTCLDPPRVCKHLTWSTGLWRFHTRITLSLSISAVLLRLIFGRTEAAGYCWSLGASVSGLVGEEVVGKAGASELLMHQVGEEQQRIAWPVVYHDVLGLPGGVAGDGDDDFERLALDLRGVVLEKTIIAVVTGEVEVLELIQLSGLDHDGTDGLRAVRGAVHRRGLQGDIVGQVVQPLGVVVLDPHIAGPTGAPASGIPPWGLCHVVPPSEFGSAPDTTCGCV